jgi:hypothetical protein
LQQCGGGALAQNEALTSVNGERLFGGRRFGSWKLATVVRCQWKRVSARGATRVSSVVVTVPQGTETDIGASPDRPTRSVDCQAA